MIISVMSFCMRTVTVRLGKFQCGRIDPRPPATDYLLAFSKYMARTFEAAFGHLHWGSFVYPDEKVRLAGISDLISPVRHSIQYLSTSEGACAHNSTLDKTDMISIGIYHL